MSATAVLGVAGAVLGILLVAFGLQSSVVDRRRAATASYFAELDDLDDLPPAGSVEPGAGGDDLDDVAHQLARPFMDRVLRPSAGRLVDVVRTLTPGDRRAATNRLLARAGLDADIQAEEMLATQAISVVLGVVLGVAVIASGALPLGLALAAAALLALIGAVVPLAWLRRQVDRRSTLIRQELPETLDLLAISVEAGLGLEGAMQVVVDRSHGPLAQELSRTLQELSLGLSRRDALVNLRQRSRVPELSGFVQALLQADTLGMPVARVLKLQAAEQRHRRRQWSRERAAKLPVKILLPLVACIFPAVLVIVLGPAVAQIGEAL